jgi:hypothetical protein
MEIIYKNLTTGSVCKVEFESFAAFRVHMNKTGVKARIIEPNDRLTPDTTTEKNWLWSYPRHFNLNLEGGEELVRKKSSLTALEKAIREINRLNGRKIK